MLERKKTHLPNKDKHSRITNPNKDNPKMKFSSLYSHPHADGKTKQNSVAAFSVTAEVDGESLQARRSQTDFVRHHFHP